jgi:hypothetical protein
MVQIEGGRRERMTIEHLLITIAVLLYLLGGVGFALVYVLNYRQQDPHTARIGVMVLCWIFLIIIDVFHDAILHPLGATTKKLATKANQ